MSWFDEQDGAEAGTPGGPVPGGQVSGDGQGGGAGGYQPFDQAMMQQILRRYPPTNDGIRQAAAELDRTFGPGVVSLLDHPERLDKFRLPNGQVIDVVGGAGGPNPTHAWMVEGPGHGGGAGMGYGAGPLGPGSSPDYQFVFDEGRKAIEKSAAAKGTLMTGGTLKALARYGSGVASGEYQNTFNRLYSTAQLGLQGAGGVVNAGSAYGRSIGDLMTQRGNAQAAGQVGAANAWGGTIGDVANIGAQWYAGRRGARPGAPAPPDGARRALPPDYQYDVPYPDSPLRY